MSCGALRVVAEVGRVELLSRRGGPWGRGNPGPSGGLDHRRARPPTLSRCRRRLGPAALANIAVGCGPPLVSRWSMTRPQRERPRPGRAVRAELRALLRRGPLLGAPPSWLTRRCLAIASTALISADRSSSVLTRETSSAGQLADQNRSVAHFVGSDALDVHGWTSHASKRWRVTCGQRAAGVRKRYSPMVAVRKVVRSRKAVTLASMRSTWAWTRAGSPSPR